MRQKIIITYLNNMSQVEYEADIVTEQYQGNFLLLYLDNGSVIEKLVIPLSEILKITSTR